MRITVDENTWDRSVVNDISETTLHQRTRHPEKTVCTGLRIETRLDQFCGVIGNRSVKAIHHFVP